MSERTASQKVPVALASTKALNGETWSTPAVGHFGAARTCALIATDRSGDIVAFFGHELNEGWRRNLGAAITASPTVSDINQDGDDEIIIGTEDGILYALRMCDGMELWRVRCGTSIRATAAVCDVDGDGASEVIVSGYGAWMFCLAGTTGVEKWRKYLPKHEFYRASKCGVVSSPLIADVDLDGELEIVTGTRSRRVFCLSAATGRMKWFRELRYDPDSTPSFAIVDDVPTVFVGGGEHTCGLGDNALLALRGSDGAVMWRAHVHGGLDSSPIIADIDGDGCLEVIESSLADASCYAFSAQSGAIRWQYKFGPTDDCVHDVNNICRSTTTDHYFTERAVCRSYTTPLIADLDADGRIEVVVGSNNGCLAILDGATGSVRYAEETGGMIRGSPILADLNDDGRLELIVASGKELRIYRTEAVAMGCNMFKHQPDHLGWLQPSQARGMSARQLPKQRLRHLQLLWHWLVVDAFRYVFFQLELKLLKPFKLKLADYYY
jgi:outer membrane protein assembly factor BamB